MAFPILIKQQCATAYELGLGLGGQRCLVALHAWGIAWARLGCDRGIGRKPPFTFFHAGSIRRGLGSGRPCRLRRRGPTWLFGGQSSWLSCRRSRWLCPAAGRAAFETVEGVHNELVVLDRAFEHIGRDNISDSARLLAIGFVGTKIISSSDLSIRVYNCAGNTSLPENDRIVPIKVHRTRSLVCVR